MFTVCFVFFMFSNLVLIISKQVYSLKQLFLFDNNSPLQTQGTSEPF